MRTPPLLALLGCLACAAPAETDVAVPEPAAGDPTTTSPPAPVARALFDVTSDVVGPIRLREPVTIETTVRARASVERAQLVLAMPEVAAARATGWGAEYRMFGVGVRPPAIDSAVASVAPGRPFTRRTTLRFEAPGYYFVVASAAALDEVRFEENGVPLVDPQHHTYHVWVDEEGGYTTPDFDPTRLPLASDGAAGPLHITRGSPMTQLLDSARIAPRTHGVVEGVVLRADGQPAADARVEVRAYMEGCPGRGAAEETARTDRAGRYRVTLHGWPRTPFDACVAVHADLDGEHATVRVDLRMNGAQASSETTRVDLRLES